MPTPQDQNQWDAAIPRPTAPSAMKNMPLFIPAMEEALDVALAPAASVAVDATSPPIDVAATKAVETAPVKTAVFGLPILEEPALVWELELVPTAFVPSLEPILAMTASESRSVTVARPLDPIATVWTALDTVVGEPSEFEYCSPFQVVFAVESVPVAVR